MHLLSQKMNFPDVNLASHEGLLAYGGDLSVERLILAYSKGIFPWFEVSEPILWWSPDPRFVLFPEELKVSKSLRKTLKKNNFQITTNKCFEKVILECAVIDRKGQKGTWITEEMINAYNNLHKQGLAKSIEVWQGKDLIGGFYGVDLNNGVFCGESMFSKVSNASKIGFVYFIENSNYKLIDCQVYTKHLESFGAKHISRNKFIELLTNKSHR
jgi:leucyl/phenylalanyl-tRNA--protein transferase